MSFFSKLTREQKEAIGLLQIGTFLEYFDLMLYVHMAVLLNELFFPKTDPHTASLLAALAFCSTYVLRPFGALLFGWIGDNIGRKSTVIITTTMMSVSCLVMATLPTYAQIGITASWAVTICRIIQGLSSMGEIMGAEIYITEITKPPSQYVAVSMVVLSSSLGGVAALGLASFVTKVSLDWRYGFWIGAGIAVVGAVARSSLRETPEFVDMKRKKQAEIEKNIKSERNQKIHLEKLKKEIKNSKVSLKTFFASFCVECSAPFVFYVSYIYFNPTLKAFGYSSSDIIHHNFILSLIYPVFFVGLMIMITRIHPLKILKFRSWQLLFMMIMLPIWAHQATSPSQIFFLQSLFVVCLGGGAPAMVSLIKCFPVQRRFTVTTFVYALSRACVHITTAFGLVYLTEWVGLFSVWIIGLPLALVFFWGVRHFEKLEGLIPDKMSHSTDNVIHSQAE